MLLAATMAGAAVLAAPDRPCGGGAWSRPYDLLITDGIVMDGSGRAPRMAQVAICDDRIAAVSAHLHADARDTIRARDQVVSPGFIDLLGQSELTLLRDGRALSKLSQGITSEITGEATSVVPASPGMRAALAPGLRSLAEWRDLDGYWVTLARARPAINIGTFVSVGTLRTAAVANTDRPATPAELSVMRAHLIRAMRAGAFGISAALAYPPAANASSEELNSLATVAAGYGGGYATHLRDEGPGVTRALEEAIRIGDETGAWVLVHHLKAAGPEAWGQVGAMVDAVHAARARGLRIWGDQYPYTSSSANLSLILPLWVRTGSSDSLLGRLKHPGVRQRLRDELARRWRTDASRSPGDTGTSGPASARLVGVSSQRLVPYLGQTLSAIARQRHQDPADALMGLILADRDRSTVALHSMREEDVMALMREPWVAIGTDAGAISVADTIRFRPHPRTFGTFPRVVGRYVNERHLMTLPEAVRRFTALPAHIVGLRRRGLLLPGYYADITVFDPHGLKDRATFDDPYHLSDGVRAVIVNGKVAWRDGVATGARSGRALRHETPPRADDIAR